MWLTSVWEDRIKSKQAKNKTLATTFLAVAVGFLMHLVILGLTNVLEGLEFFLCAGICKSLQSFHL